MSLKEATLYWHLNKVIGNNDNLPYTNWNNFQNTFKAEFSNFQQFI